MRVYPGILSISCLLLVLGCFGVNSTASVYINEHNSQFIVDYGQNLTFDTIGNSASSDTISQIPDPPEYQSKTDTIFLHLSDNALEHPVIYKVGPNDSIIYDVRNGKIFMYGDAQVNYQNIQLNAALIEIDWKRNLLTAEGITDSAGNTIGRPVFSESGQTFRSRRILYNFQSNKGKIYDLITQEGEGFIHGEEVLKTEEDHLFAARAKYTTCNLDHPHFWIEADPLKIIPDRMIVCGPANLVVEGVRTPLVLPFAIFPIKEGQRSGILPPDFSDTREWGFGLTNGGYYFGISDNMDLAIRGDIFTSGSWRFRANTNFVKRYRYSGDLNFTYGAMNTGDELLGNEKVARDFSLGGSYRLSEKAWPNNRISATLNFATSGFNQYNTTAFQDRYTNEYRSGLNYSRLFPGKPYNLSASLQYNYNTNTQMVNVQAPQVNFGVARFNPFERRTRVGATQWYERISMSYNMSSRNSVVLPDSVFLSNQIWSHLSPSMTHSVPINSNFRILNYLNVTPNINYNETWGVRRVRQVYDPHVGEDGESVIYVRRDTLGGFAASRHFNMGVNTNTRLYGRANFARGPVTAVRHVLEPRLGFQYTPDFSDPFWGYYDTVTTAPGREPQLYQIYPTGIFGSIPSGKRAGLSIGLGNNLEMKVRSRNDTVSTERKIRIFERLNFNTFYNFAADSMHLSPLTFTGNTRLFEGFSLNFSGAFDPYALNEEGRRVDKWEWNENSRLARLTNANFSLSTSFNADAFNKRVYHPQMHNGYFDHLGRYMHQPLNYTVYDVPWDVSLDYTIHLRRAVNQPDSMIVSQTLQSNFMFSLTPKWTIRGNAGWDFDAMDFSNANLSIHRDLHCWEMHFNWIPFGTMQSYNFGLRVKSTILSDLKIEKRSSPYGNVPF